MSYLVLARKYRPQRFSELVGQEPIARTLVNAIEQNRVHHAFLFTGARGVGKTSAARILAKALDCVKGPTAEPCGVCDFCTEIAGGHSVDVIEIDAASNTKVEETKAVLEGVRYMPARARRKVYIIDEVHMLSAHSWNALLKTLEEPPPHVVFIFATTEVHKIPITILSRCQRFDFKLIPTARLGEHLQSVLAAEQLTAAPEAVRLIARQAAGSVRDGLSLLDQVIAYVGTEPLTAEVVADVLGIADRRLLVELAGAVVGRDPATALRLLARATDRGVDVSQLARAFLAFLRDLEIAARVGDPRDLIDATDDELEETRALAARAAPGRVPVLFDRWARAVDEASRSTMPRLLFEMALVDLAASEPLVPLGDLLERLEEMEGRVSSGAARRLRVSAAPAPAAPTPAPPAPAPGSRSWATPAGAAPAAPAPATAAQPSSPPSPPAAAPASAEEAWRSVLAGLQSRRPSLAMALDQARVVAASPGAVTLALPSRRDADSAEKARAEIEAAMSAALGQATRLTFTVAEGQGATGDGGASAGAEAAAADRKNRETEARQHPMIRRAQDVFGASLKEIKT
jgi:DNA polymerase-3 subunit gamma/tau